MRRQNIRDTKGTSLLEVLAAAGLFLLVFPALMALLPRFGGNMAGMASRMDDLALRVHLRQVLAAMEESRFPCPGLDGTLDRGKWVAGPVPGSASVAIGSWNMETRAGMLHISREGVTEVHAEGGWYLQTGKPGTDTDMILQGPGFRKKVFP